MKKPITGLALVFVLALTSVWFATDALAEIKTKSITYQDNGVTLKGMMAWDDAKSGKRPGILVIHEWWGLNDYAKDRARQLAAAGYVAFALDMYGGDKVTGQPKIHDLNQSARVRLWHKAAQLALLPGGPLCPR